MTNERLAEIEARDENMLNRDEMIADLLEHVRRLRFAAEDALLAMEEAGWGKRPCTELLRKELQKSNP